jgi:two-component system LytT family sensor kinase
MQEHRTTRRGKSLAAIAGIWLAIALFFSLQNIVRYITRGWPVDWLWTVAFEFLYWTPWIFLTPFLLFMVRRFRLEPDSWRRTVWPHLGAAILVAVLQTGAADLLQYGALVLAGRPEEQVVRFGQSMRVGFPVLVLTAFWKYWVFVGVYYAFDYYRKYRERELRASKLESQLATAELQALKGQLHPHFLFNTLHSVSMLNLTDADQANRILVLLSDLLRGTLDSDRAQEVPLRSELDLVDRYLQIERIRLGDRLAVEYRVDESLLGAMVPSLILQPIVENAIRHGVSRRSSPGTVVIRGGRHGNALTLDVENDGPGLRADWLLQRDAGLGLRNCDARLAALYDSEGRIEVTAREGSGVRVRITIPLRFESQGERAAGG